MQQQLKRFPCKQPALTWKAVVCHLAQISLIVICYATVTPSLFASDPEWSISCLCLLPAIPNQVKSLHRFGNITDCERKFEDFKFCMSTKTLTKEQRDQAWIQRRAEWWAGRRLGPSSEDVWTAKRYDSCSSSIGQVLTSCESYPNNVAEKMQYLRKDQASDQKLSIGQNQRAAGSAALDAGIQLAL